MVMNCSTSIVVTGKPVGVLEVRDTKVFFASNGYERCCSTYPTSKQAYIEYSKLKKIVRLELVNEEYRDALTVERALDIVDYTFAFFNDLKAM